MSVIYKTSIKKLLKHSAVLDIYYNKQDTPSSLSKKVDAKLYHFIVVNTQTIYVDIEKMNSTLEAVYTLWDNSDISNIYIHIPILLLKDIDTVEHILYEIVNTSLKNVFKSKKKIIITHDGDEDENLKNIISLIQKIQMARSLSMLPANMATPEKIANKLNDLYQPLSKIRTKILNKDYLKKHHFNLILSVNKGSKNDPCVLVVERKILPKYPTVCIIGKGITFDSGGLAIKPLKYMKDMKFDKIGAVNGAMALLHLLEMKSLKHFNLVGIFPFAENVISETAILPGDVIRSFSGKTVEIINPDAEGRLILADALAYAKKYKPDLIIDIATLTGHAESINCWHNGYFFAEPNPLRSMFETRTNAIGERMIAMPPWSEYNEALQSKVADLINDSSSCDDSFTAALFLREFLPANTDWIHIDLAHEQKNSIPKGTGIRSIVDIVKRYVPKKK